MKVHHPIPPFYALDSEILILGSFPSAKSREAAFFYAHPQNRFWSVLARVFFRPVPKTIEEKKRFLRATRIALWDVIGSCEITNSADSSIKSVIPNNLSEILSDSAIRKIFVNGKTAEKLYQQFIFPKTKISAVYLPSTSPANAGWSPDLLISAWKIIREDV